MAKKDFPPIKPVLPGIKIPRYIVKVSTLTLGPLAPAIPCCPGVPTAPCINKQWIQSLLLLTATFKKIIHLPSQLFTDQSLAMGHDTVTVPIRDK